MAWIQLVHSYEHIISLENLLDAWTEFVKGKRQRKDVQYFERDLMKNIISLHNDLVAKTYAHSDYYAFNISDPKPRNIHKASVRDRLLHHAVYRILYPFFERTFIADSYSCRKGKGVQKALKRFRSAAYKVSHNHTRIAWVLKCDIRKFFASIDHARLKEILMKYIPDADTTWLLSRIMDSFEASVGRGLPLGNLTSQLLVNVYMNEFDQFAKHMLKAKYYIRYADDFAFLSSDKVELENMLEQVNDFLQDELRLALHPDKVSIKTFSSGIDFLGWVHFPDHRVLRTATKHRMFRIIREKEGKKETIQSYLGMLNHGNAQNLKQMLVTEPKVNLPAAYHSEP